MDHVYLYESLDHIRRELSQAGLHVVAELRPAGRKQINHRGNGRSFTTENTEVTEQTFKQRRNSKRGKTPRTANDNSNGNRFTTEGTEITEQTFK